MLCTIVRGKYVVAEVVRRVPPHRMDVVPAALRIVVLDQQVRPLDPEVVPLAGRRAARPGEREVLHARRFDPPHLRGRHVGGQPPGEPGHQLDERVQPLRGQLGTPHALGPAAQVAQDRPLRVGDPVIGLRLEDVIGQFLRADARHHAGGEVRRRPVIDHRGRPLPLRQRGHERSSPRLVVRERRERTVSGGNAAEHARGGGDMLAACHGEIQRHVMPGELPAPRPGTARRPEDPETVPFRVEQVRDRGGVKEHHRPPHVLHRHDRHDLRVPGHAHRGRDQPVRELALRVGEGSDGKPGPGRLGQVRPFPPRSVKFKIVIQNVPLRLVKHRAERDRGSSHLSRGLRCQERPGAAGLH
jgi:hypothetical protein